MSDFFIDEEVFFGSSWPNKGGAFIIILGEILRSSYMVVGIVPNNLLFKKLFLFSFIDYNIVN